MNQENEERQRRNENALGPGAQKIRNRWNAKQVNNHEKLFPFSGNMLKLMFIVESDLSEAQRERDLQVPFLLME